MKLNWKQVLISFLLGLLVGMGTLWCARRYHFHKMMHGEDRYAHMLDRFSKKLKLTPDQKEKVKVILEAKRQKIKALRAQVGPKFEEIKNSTEAEIQKLLTPEQQEKFESFKKKWEGRWKKRHFGRE